MAFESNQTTETCDYTIQAATMDDRPAIFEFIKKFFYTAEPLNEAVNRKENKTPTHKYEDSPMAYLLEGLSLKAVAASGEIIGVSLCSEIKPEENVLEPNGNSGLDGIHRILNIVEDKISELSKSTHNNIKEMEVRVITVHENWRNKQIGRILLEHSKDLAKKKGYKQIRSICTSAYTSRMFARSGFECIYSLQYTDCIKQEIIKYLPQEPHTHINGMILKF